MPLVSGIWRRLRKFEVKDTVFYFEFSLYDEETDNGELFSKGFIIKDYEFLSDDQDKCDAFEDTCSDIECKYGVHDWCTSPDDRVDGIGYCSNEVEKIDELMEVWRQVFIKEGAEVTEVADFNWEDGDNDYDIYQKLLGDLI